MTLSEFSSLPIDEKTNYLWDYGVCIGQRLHPQKFIVCIFQLEGFYVEALYSRKNNCVNQIQPLRELPEWEAYVERTLRQLVQLS